MAAEAEQAFLLLDLAFRLWVRAAETHARVAASQILDAEREITLWATANAGEARDFAAGS